MTAANLGSRITGYGFAVFLVGSLAWLATGVMTGQPALTWTNAVLTVLNIFGVWRWLGRQAQVEEGARAASRSERGHAGRGAVPDLAAVARRRSTARTSGSANASTPWPAAAAAGSTMSSSPKAASAGVGETLRRLPWCDAHVEGEAVRHRPLARTIPRAGGARTRPMAGALIVTAEIAQRDFSWLEHLRRSHYPAERNQVPAHLTMFHALPPSAEPEVRSGAGRVRQRQSRRARRSTA